MKKRTKILACIITGLCFAGLFGGMFSGTANLLQWPLPVQLFSAFAAVVTALGAYADLELHQDNQS